MKSGLDRILSWIAGMVVTLSLCTIVTSAERTARFDSDPAWHGHNNRTTSSAPRRVKQDFGYSTSAHAESGPGEMGGLITAAAEPAYYAKEIPTRTFDDVLSASGRIVCARGGFHVLVGFFNTATLNEWRTPNSISIRLQGRGDFFFAYVEYCTGRWRAGGDSPGGFTTIRDSTTGRLNLKGFPSGTNVHQWSMRYDPAGNRGNGSITVTLDHETAICHLDVGHKADGAAFNRFGLLNVMKTADDAGHIWLDDVTINGETEFFAREPGWDQFQNRRAYATRNVRPWFDFGYSATRHADGEALGEIGGLVFRGDGRHPNLMAFYGDRLEELTLAAPLKASGRISLRRGVTDSDVLVGFFHAQHSMNSGGSDAISLPPDFLGISIGGPSREGFMLTPAYRLHNTEKRTNTRGPYLHPNGTSHDWTLAYSPDAAGAQANITATLDGERSSLTLPREHQAIGAHFNRFGIISTHTDGNGQHIYFDDLTYTWTQAK